jgi:hypothetical protein
MRISRRIRLGRLEMYIGRRPHWPVIWSHGRVNVGNSSYEFWLGRCYVIATWLPSKRERARRDAEWEAEMLARYGDDDDNGADGVNPKAPA